MRRDYPIGLVMATEHEAAPFIEREGLHAVEEKPFRIYAGERFRLIIGGIGKANAAMAAARMVWSYGHSALYNLGAAGATGPGAVVGDIYHIESILELDRPGVLSKKPRFIKPDTLEGFRRGTLCTQDHPVIEPAERETIRPHAGLVDMEGAAFAQACRLAGARAYLFKIVTDTPVHETDRDIIVNIELTRHRLYEYACREVFDLEPGPTRPR